MAAYDIWQTCVLVPDVDATNCAGWVQAWGSLLGLAVAIGVPWAMWAQENKVKMVAELARARVAGADVLLMTTQILGFLAAIGDRIKLAPNGDYSIPHGEFRAEFETIGVPDQEQIVAMLAFDHDLAIALAHGRRHLLQIRQVVSLFGRLMSNELFQIRVKALRDLLPMAIEQFAVAEEKLMAFLDEGSEHRREVPSEAAKARVPAEGLSRAEKTSGS